MQSQNIIDNMLMEEDFWTKLDPLPGGKISVPISINEREFLVIPETAPFWSSASRSYGMYTYDIKLSKWTKFDSYLPTFQSTQHAIAVCKRNNLVYIQNAEQELLELNLKTKILKTISPKCNISGNSAAICARNELHIVSSNGIHFMWDKTIKQFKQIHIFTEYFKEKKGIKDHRLIYLKSTNSILLFGGRQTYGREKYDSIYSFSIIDNKWSKLSVTLPIPLCCFGITTMKSDEYILIFGGQTKNAIISKSIFIFNVKENKFEVSRVTCPREMYKCYAINTGTYERYYNKLLIVGFMKQFVDLQQLPEDIINLTEKMFSHVSIHLIDSYVYDLGHWKICADDIFKEPYSTLE